MKRMFVRAEHHGKGVGRALGEAVTRAAETAGYKTVLLDTSIRQKKAQGLYKRLGFDKVAPYYEMPDVLRSWLFFMERPITAWPQALRLREIKSSAALTVTGLC
jgi:ribosomal protein S18 acetylase RimI-like enzyme